MLLNYQLEGLVSDLNGVIETADLIALAQNNKFKFSLKNSRKETMSISYDEAMDNLKAMFTNLDRGVIHKVLASHSTLSFQATASNISEEGQVDRTIGDLLKLAEEKEDEEYTCSLSILLTMCAV